MKPYKLTQFTLVITVNTLVFTAVLLSDAVGKSQHTVPSCRPVLSSISESTTVPAVPGVPGVVLASESGVWVRSNSVNDDAGRHVSDVKCKDSNESGVTLVNDNEVILCCYQIFAATYVDRHKAQKIRSLTNC